MATILIVDDCAKTRQHFATPLQRQGHRLLEASDGVNALALARSERPHLVIAGARMPMQDGIEIVRGLRSDQQLADTRIILYSDHDFQNEAIALTHAIDVPLVLPKPKKPEEVVSMVDRVLSQARERVTPAEAAGHKTEGKQPRSPPRRFDAEASEFEKLTSRNQELTAELQTLSEHLGRETEKRAQAEQRLSKIQGWYHLGSRSANDNRLQALFENALDAVLLADDDQHFLEANPAACDLLGYARHELLQMSRSDINFPQYAGVVQDSWQKLLSQGKMRGEFTIRRKDGTPLEVECRAVANALPGLHLSLMQDITERKNVERRLRESEERFRQIAEHIGEVFWLNDPEHAGPVYVSPAYEKIWGRDREELSRSHFSWAEAIHPADRDRVFESAKAMYANAHYDQTYRILRPDGSLRWIKDRAFPIYNANGEVIRMAGIAQDITELKHAEEELVRYAQRLEAMSAIDHAILAAHSSHEIARAVVSGINRLIPCQLASVIAFEGASKRAQILAASKNGQTHRSTGTHFASEALGDLHDLRAGQVRITEDFLAYSQTPPLAEAMLENGIRSEVVFPIVSQHELIGMFTLGSEQPGAFDQEHVALVREIGERVAVAMQDARLFDQVRSGQERLRALTGQLMKAQENERRRIARELHDEIGQALTVTKMSLQTLDKTAEDFSLATQRTMQSIERVLQQVRNLSLDLRPPMLDDLGLVAALRGYLDRQAQSVEFSLLFDLDEVSKGLTSEIETACFRVVQEAMTNVVRHAHPSRVAVELRQHEADLQLLIRDDGIGFDVAAARQRAVRGESLGLLGMEERVQLLGGRIEIQSATNCGTEIHVQFPM